MWFIAFVWWSRFAMFLPWDGSQSLISLSLAPEAKRALLGWNWTLVTSLPCPSKVVSQVLLVTSQILTVLSSPQLANLYSRKLVPRPQTPSELEFSTERSLTSPERLSSQILIIPFLSQETKQLELKRLMTSKMMFSWTLNWSHWYSFDCDDKSTN